MQTLERNYAANPAFRQLPPPKPGSVAEVIAKAMDYLDENGWCKFVARNNAGETCGHGSLMESVHKELNQMPLYEMEYPDIDPTRVLGLDSIPPLPKLVPNKERDLLFSAEVRAHEYLMRAAIEDGWRSEGGELECFLEGKPYTPFKDAFAVFNDDPRTTVEDVKLTMKRAIELATADEM